MKKALEMEGIKEKMQNGFNKGLRLAVYAVAGGVISCYGYSISHKCGYFKRKLPTNIIFVI